jgi:hypothetical protein
VLVSFEWRAVGETSEVPTSSEWMAPLYTIRRDEIVRLEFFDERGAATTAAKATT